MALVLAAAVYAMLSGFLIYVTWRVAGSPPWPAWMVRFYHWKWRGTLKGFFTVRYEIDDDGLWQIVEESATGNRYRVQVRDANGEMKW